MDGGQDSRGVLLMRVLLVKLVLLCVAVERTDFSIGIVIPRLTPNVKRLLILAVPAAMAGGITQINLLIGQIKT